MPSVARWIGLVLLLGSRGAWAAEGPVQVVPAALGQERPPDSPAPAAAAARPAEPAVPLPLGAPARSRSEHGKPTGGLPALVTVTSSLAVVLGLFLAGVWAMRRAMPRGSLVLPAEVFEVLGRAPLAGRQQVHLLRCGRKLLLVCVTPAGTETLTEVTEPSEVDRLAGVCRQAHPNSATAAFRQIFQQWAPRHPHQPSHGDGAFEEVGAGQGTRQRGRRTEDDDA